MQLLHQPAVYFVLCILLMLGLDYYAPILPVLSGEIRVIGTIFFALGALVAAFAFGRLKRADTPTHPHGTPAVLVTDGPFAYSRNPIYLGLALVLLGFAFRLGSLSPFLIVPLFIWTVDHYFIRSEETRLEQQFGASFTAYRERVRRWL